MTWLTDRAAPPLSSTSALERMMPSMPAVSLKARACSVASLPVVDSPMNILRSGLLTRTIFSISRMRFSLVYIRPAVSMRTALVACFFA